MGNGVKDDLSVGWEGHWDAHSQMGHIWVGNQVGQGLWICIKGRGTNSGLFCALTVFLQKFSSLRGSQHKNLGGSGLPSLPSDGLVPGLCSSSSSLLLALLA